MEPKNIPLIELRPKLSEVLRLVESGTTFAVTRYGKAVAIIGPPTQMDPVDASAPTHRKAAEPVTVTSVYRTDTGDFGTPDIRAQLVAKYGPNSHNVWSFDHPEQTTSSEARPGQYDPAEKDGINAERLAKMKPKKK